MKKSLLSLALLALTATGALSADPISQTTASAVNSNPAGTKTIKVDGTLSMAANQSVKSITLEVGTIANNVFTPNANTVYPSQATVIGGIQCTVANNVATYTYNYVNPVAAGTYSVRVTPQYTEFNAMLIPTFKTMSPNYAPVTIP